MGTSRISFKKRNFSQFDDGENLKLQWKLVIKNQGIDQKK